MDIVASIIAIIILIALLIYVRRHTAVRTERPARPAVSMSDTGTKFHAVSIRYASSACAAAREMEGRRFLSSAAPKLPLPECDAAECKCRFKHHEDRRSGRERRNVWGGQGFGGSTTGQYPKEQRKGSDRRRDEPPDEFLT